MLNSWKKVVLVLVVSLLLVGAMSAQYVIAAEKESPYIKWVDTKVVDTLQWKKDPPWTIGFSNASISNSWRVFLLRHLEYQASKYPEIGKLYVTDANDSPVKQIADTEDLLAKGIDCLIISPCVEEGLNPVVNKAMAQGVPVVVVDRRVTTPNYVTFVRASNEALGKMELEWLVEELNGKGNIILLSGIAGAGPAEVRLAAAREVIKKHPGIKVLAQEYCDWSAVKGKRVMASLIVKFGDKIDAVWCDSALHGCGAVDAYIDAGLPIPIFTGDDTNRFFKQWKKHGFKGYAASFPVWMSMPAVDAAVYILSGICVPRDLLVPSLVTTDENLDAWVRFDLPDGFLVDQKLPDEWLPEQFRPKK